MKRIYPVETGVIFERIDAQSCLVRFADGRQALAVLAYKTLQRKHGCLFGSLVGRHVDVAMFPSPKLPRIIRLTETAAKSESVEELRQ